MGINTLTRVTCDWCGHSVEHLPPDQGEEFDVSGLEWYWMPQELKPLSGEIELICGHCWKVVRTAVNSARADLKREA